METLGHAELSPARSQIKAGLGDSEDPLAALQRRTDAQAVNSRWIIGKTGLSPHRKRNATVADIAPCAPLYFILRLYVGLYASRRTIAPPRDTQLLASFRSNLIETPFNLRHRGGRTQAQDHEAHDARFHC